MTENHHLEKIRETICALHATLREQVLRSRNNSTAEDLSAVAETTEADTIYAIDKISETVILDWFENNWPTDLPMELVMEGLENRGTVTFPNGTAVADTRFKYIMDPIDGTRCLMYDKRSAWILSAVAPQRGNATCLQDLQVAVMTELPPSKQTLADEVSGIRGQGTKGIRAMRTDLISGNTQPISIRPSQADNFAHGFASLARFFPEGKEFTARLELALWEQLKMTGFASPMIFDDQYMSTGGQIYELLCGHDRMLGDIRPLVHHHLGLDKALSCHPYDICTAFLLEEAGGVLEAPDGQPVNAPLDTISPVAWIGYANPKLAQLAGPVLRNIISENLTHDRS